MLIVDHVLRLRRVHVVRVTRPPAGEGHAPTHGAQLHAAAASTCPVHEARCHRGGCVGGDGAKAVARRTAASAAAEGLLLLQLLVMMHVRVSTRRRLREGVLQRNYPLLMRHLGL